MSSRRTNDEQRPAVKNSHSSRDNRQGDRRDGHHQPEQRRSDGRHHVSSSYHRRLSADDDQRRAGRRDEHWRRERDEQQRPKRRERPAFTEEEGEREPCDLSRPSWQNTKVRKHAEMLKERKMLWKGKGGSGAEHREGDEGEMTTTTRTNEDSKPAGTELVTERKEKQLEHKWQSMIAATAQDTQQMDKFQRLMGMKKNAAATADSTPSQQQNDAEQPAAAHGPAPAAALPDNAELNRERMRQMELQRGLNQQFELARQSHHCARGRGLGSF